MKAERSAIVGKLLAQMMVMSGFKHIITMDLHQKELQGFFDCPVDNLRASPFLISYMYSVKSKCPQAWGIGHWAALGSKHFALFTGVSLAVLRFKS